MMDVLFWLFIGVVSVLVCCVVWKIFAKNDDDDDSGGMQHPMGGL